MAKQLCMLARNEKGMGFRRYFVECENKQSKILKSLEFIDLKMENSLVFQKNGKSITNSKTIASVFEKEHRKVIRDIENKIEELSKTEEGLKFTTDNFGLCSYIGDNGQEYKSYELTEQGFSFVVLSYTGEKANSFKIRFINDFFKMRENILKLFKARVIENVLPQKTKNRQYVYIIKNKDSGNIKVGVGTDPSNRLKQLQTGSDSELELVYSSYICSNAFELENKVHKAFDKCHVRGEWFKVNEDSVISFLESNNYCLKTEIISNVYGIDSNLFINKIENIGER